MKNLIGIDIGSYSFNPIAHTITLGGVPTLKKEQLLIITNVTSNVMLYNFADPTIGSTINNNIITLAYDTSSMLITDNLQIFVEIADNSNDQATFQRHLLQMIRSLGIVDSNNRQKIAVETMPTTTVTLSSNAVVPSNVTTIAAPLTGYAIGAANWGYFTEGPVSQLFRYNADLTMAYNTGNRSNLKFT